MMKQHSKRTLLRAIVCTVLIAAMALACMGCGAKEEPQTQAPQAVEVRELGQGAKTFAFEVEDIDGAKQAFLIHTDADTVGQALLELELIQGEPGPYGLYVKQVCGITAVFEEDGTYWAFYENGEYGMTGVDETDIDQSVTYSFVKTEG